MSDENTPASPTITGSCSATIGSVVITTPTIAQGYSYVAKELLKALRLLQGQNTIHVTCLLAGQALELLLKTYLRRNNTNALINRSHDLERLWRDAVSDGLPSTGPLQNEWLSILNSFHSSPFIGRYYGEINGAIYPPEVPLLEALEALAAYIDTLS